MFHSVLLLGLLTAGDSGALSRPESVAAFEYANEVFGNAYYRQAGELYRRARQGFLAEGDTDRAEACRVRMYQAQRILEEYPYTKQQAVRLLAEHFEDVPVKQRDAWLDDGTADFRVIDGQPRYFHDFVKNLKFRNPRLLREDPKMVEGELGMFTKYHSLIFRQADEDHPSTPWKPFVNPVTFLVTGTLSIPRHELPEHGLLRIWLPLPIQTAAQDGIQVISLSPEEYVRTVPSVDGDLGIIYLEIPLEELEEDLQFTMRLVFRHFEQRFRVDPENVGHYDRNGLLYQKYTKSHGNITVNDSIRQKAREIVGDQTNPYLAAKKIYDYVVDSVWYSFTPHLTLNVLGEPESVFVHENGYGDCGAQSAYFCALCRAVGIPARDTGGWQLCPGHTGGHFWAEFYLPSYGWVPVDTSIAQTAGYAGTLPEEKVRAFREYYFGNMDPYRYVIQTDLDLPLSPDPGEPVFLPMAIQGPAIVCVTSEKDPSFLVDGNWKMEFIPIDK